MPVLTTPQPEPLEAAARERSLRLQQRLIAQIQTHGPMPFAEYMQRCLYEPELGYYTAPNPIFGVHGDFITAPEIGDLFAYGLAQQIAALVRLHSDWPPVWTIVEAGAGSGQLAYDLLQHLHQLKCLPARYLIVETSAELRRRQQHKLRELAQALGLNIETVAQPPAMFDGVMIANEVLDALPVERVKLTAQGWQRIALSCRAAEVAAPNSPECSASTTAAALQWCTLPLTQALQQQLQHRLDYLAELPEAIVLSPPYECEIPHLIQPWLSGYASALRYGAMLFIDYGYPRHEYYHPQRRQGTLINYLQHKAFDNPLLWPGLQDFTAFVDFTTLAEAADDLGLEVMGYTSQAQFLLANNVLAVLENLTDTTQQVRLAEQVRRLMLPGEMGERFQVMLLGRGLSDAGPGFVVDLRYRL